MQWIPNPFTSMRLSRNHHSQHSRPSNDVHVCRVYRRPCQLCRHCQGIEPGPNGRKLNKEPCRMSASPGITKSMAGKTSLNASGHKEGFVLGD